MESHFGRLPFVIFFVNNSKSEIIKMLNAVQKMKGSRFLVSPDGGNPFSGDGWYKPSVSIGCDAGTISEADKFFDKLNEAVIDEKKQEIGDDLEVFMQVDCKKQE